MFYFFGPISPDFLLFFPTDNPGKSEIAGTGTDRRLDHSLTLTDGARRPRRPCEPVASPPRERGGRAVPAVPGPPEPLGRGERVARVVLIAAPLRATLATLWDRLISVGRHTTPKRCGRPARVVMAPSWTSTPGLGGQGLPALARPRRPRRDRSALVRLADSRLASRELSGVARHRGRTPARPRDSRSGGEQHGEW